MRVRGGCKSSKAASPSLQELQKLQSARPHSLLIAAGGTMRTRANAVALLALLAIAPMAAAQTIKLGAVVPLTGRYGAGGAQVRAGYELAVEQINAAGGVTVAGKKVPLELILLDDESDATKTVARLESLAAQGVVAYLGGFGSDLHAAAASVAEKNKIPYLGVAFALDRIDRKSTRLNSSHSLT